MPIFTKRRKTLAEYYEKRNRILVVREVGGLGDIFMHRMLFKDLKATGCEVHFACPRAAMQAVEDHPYIDKVLAAESVRADDYVVSYNTTNACIRREMKTMPYCDKHRSDIWADHIGMTITDHSMNFRVSEEQVAAGKKVLPEGVVVAVCPVSNHASKDLSAEVSEEVGAGLKRMGCEPVFVHTTALPVSWPCVYGLSVRQLVWVLAACDYVVSVDTAQFHLAGGLGKPTVGVFAYTDGKVYGKYHDKLTLVQRHRDDGDWDCGPCFNLWRCPKSPETRKPCITELTAADILSGCRTMLERFPPEKLPDLL